MEPIDNTEYQMPFNNREGRILAMSLPAPAGCLRRMIRDRGGRDVHPALVFPGTGLVQLSAYEWTDTDACCLYHEFSALVPLYSPRFPRIPKYNQKKAGAAGDVNNYLFRRSTDSEFVLGMTRDFFGWPVVAGVIDISESDGWITCDIKEKEELICRLRGRALTAPPASGTVAITIHTPGNPGPAHVDLKPLRSVTSREASDAEVILGTSHPVALEIASLVKSCNPRAYTYTPSCQVVLYGPE